MKIALFHNVPAGGAKRVIHEFGKELSKRGHEIHEYTFSTAANDFLPLLEFNISCTIQEIDWLPLVRVPIPGLSPWFHWLTNKINFSNLRKKSKKLAKRIDEGKYDLIFVHDCQFVTAPYILRYLHTPSVFYLHSIPTCFIPNLQNKDKKATFRNWMVQIPIGLHKKMIADAVVENIKFANRVLVNSNFSREFNLVHTGIDSCVVEPGVNVDTFIKRVEHENGYVFSVGALTAQKGHSLIIQALGLLSVDICPKLVIATAMESDDQKRELLSLARKNNVRIEIVTAESTAEMVKLYSQAVMSIFVPIMEPFGLAVIEAMACESPVVAVKEGGLRETVIDGETGILVEREPKSLANAILNLLNDPQLRMKLGQQARSYVEAHWTWHAAVDKLESQFWQVLNDPQ